MSIHQAVHPFLFTSATPIQPPSSFFLPLHLQQPSSHHRHPLAINPPSPSLTPVLSACSTHSFHPLSVRKPSFHFLYSSPPLYNPPPPICQHLLCSLSLTFPTPPSSPPSNSLSIPPCLPSLCLPALIKYSDLHKAAVGSRRRHLQCRPVCQPSWLSFGPTKMPTGVKTR